jgi:hypothetical protein
MNYTSKFQVWIAPILGHFCVWLAFSSVPSYTRATACLLFFEVL